MAAKEVVFGGDARARNRLADLDSAGDARHSKRRARDGAREGRRGRRKRRRLGNAEEIKSLDSVLRGAKVAVRVAGIEAEQHDAAARGYAVPWIASAIIATSFCASSAARTSVSP